MQKIIRHIAQRKIRTDEYANMNTNKTLEEEALGNTVVAKETLDSFHIDSDNYLIIDIDVIAYLLREFGKVDVSKILQISSMATGEFSIVRQKNQVPHTVKSLAEAMNVDTNKLYGFLNTLVDKNILAYCVCAPSGYRKKVYMLNPFIGRKRKDFNVYLLDFFSDVTKVHDS